MDKFISVSSGFEYGGNSKVTVTTNGYQGGDAGHGGYLEVDINMDGEIGYTFEEIEDRHYKIRAEGDWEQESLYTVAKSIVEAWETVNKIKKDDHKIYEL